MSHLISHAVSTFWPALLSPLLGAAEESSPLAGRLAFAGVFALLIFWLIALPSSKLRDADSSQPASGPSANTVRFWAVLIAAFEMLTYLFWK